MDFSNEAQAVKTLRAFFFTEKELLQSIADDLMRMTDFYYWNIHSSGIGREASVNALSIKDSYLALNWADIDLALQKNLRQLFTTLGTANGCTAARDQRRVDPWAKKSDIFYIADFTFENETSPFTVNWSILYSPDYSAVMPLDLREDSRAFWEWHGWYGHLEGDWYIQRNTHIH